MLLEAGLITEEQLGEALKYQAQEIFQKKSFWFFVICGWAEQVGDAGLAIKITATEKTTTGNDSGQT